MSDRGYIYPTDTVWGIGANIFSKSAHDLIAKIKRVDSKKPVSILFNSMEMVREYVDIAKVNGAVSWDLFFSLESTILLPVHLLKRDIPAWIIYDSSHVGIRMLTLKTVSEIIDAEGTPISTTSFNYTGTTPCTNQEDARSLFKEIGDTKLIFKSSDQERLSGHSSTIALYNEGKFNLVRKGERATQIEKLLGL